MISIIGYKIISSSQIVALLAFSLVITECYYRTQIWLAFEFKQHKSTLKKVRKERSLLDKLLGLYTSQYSLAPHHMRRYKISRVIALSGFDGKMDVCFRWVPNLECANYYYNNS